MTKRIPQVGDKYICLVKCRAKHNYPVFLGDVLEVEHISDYNAYFTNEHVWNHNSYPNDFKLVEWTTEHGHFTNYPSGNTPSSHVKPPLGLQPQSIHDNLRVKDILAAMQRYAAANKAIPNEWLEELIDKIELNHE